MRIMRALSPAAIAAIILAAAILAPAASAGTADAPEITDIHDATKDSWDINTVWFDGETNTTIDATMNLTSLESYTNPQDIPNLPTAEYEVYFSVGDSNYSVACTVPVHGPLGLFISIEIRSVMYANATSNPTETAIATITGTYTVGTHLIRFTIPKDQMGGPKAGTHLTRTWAAVWNTNRGQAERTLEDRAPNAGYGLDYIVRGTSGAEIIDVQLTAHNSTLKVSPSEPARFTVTVLNNGTSQVSLELHNMTPSEKGWTCELSIVNMTLSNGTSKIAYVTITCPRNAKRNTTASVTIYAAVHVGTQNTTSKYLLLTAVVDYIPVKVTTESNPIVALFKWIMANPKESAIYFTVIIVVVAAVSLAAILMRRSSRKKQQLAAQAPAQT
jgi:hypothetical protein